MIQNTRRSKAIARSKRTIDNDQDPISMLRNSGFEDVKVTHPELDLTNTANLIAMGNKLAEQSDEQSDVQPVKSDNEENLLSLHSKQIDTESIL